MAQGKKIDFESSLAQLEELVEQLETGNLSLEKSMAAFERGVRLTRDCQLALAEAEQKVQLLTERDGELAGADFDSEASEPDDD